MEAIHVVRAATFLAEHASDPVRLSDVADHVGYSSFHLARSFEREVGLPPGRFLAAHRFQRAKQLLLETDDRVIDVCAAVGFSAPGTFARKFAEFVGLSPTDFRRLPHMLAAAPPRPVVVPGRVLDGAVVTGQVSLTAAATALVGPEPFVYVGLFTRRAARGLPVSGALLSGAGGFTLEGVPDGSYFVLASALPRSADFGDQLVPGRTVAGRAATPVHVRAGQALSATSGYLPAASGHVPIASKGLPATSVRLDGAGAFGAPCVAPPCPVVLGGQLAQRRDIVLDVLPGWSPPVLVALPSLASAATCGWQDRR